MSYPRSYKVKTEGTRGYATSSMFYRSKRRPRRFVRKQVRFDKRVLRAVEDTMLEKGNYMVTQTNRITSTQGQQNYGSVLVQNSKLDINNIFTKITTPVSGGQPSSTLKSMRFTITGYVAQMMLKNQNNLASCRVDLYCVVPRNDTTSDPTNTFPACFIDQGNTGQDLIVGTTPFMANGFCTLYKILSKQTILLTPGATQIIEIKDMKNRKIEYERLAQNTTTNQFKGLTKIWWAVVYGEPLNDVTTKTNINISTAALDFVTIETYYYTFMPQNVVQSSTSGTYGTILTGNLVDVVTNTVGVPTNE